MARWKEVKKMNKEYEYTKKELDKLLSQKTPEEKKKLYKHLEKIYSDGKKLYNESEYLTRGY